MLQIEWRPRAVPLSPQAVLIPREQARQGLERLRRAELPGLATRDSLVLVGAEVDLPWLPEASYFGRADSAPELLLPTALEPTVPEALLARAIRARATQQQDPSECGGPWLVQPMTPGEGRCLLVSLQGVARVDPPALAAWAQGDTR